MLQTPATWHMQCGNRKSLFTVKVYKKETMKKYNWECVPNKCDVTFGRTE